MRLGADRDRTSHMRAPREERRGGFQCEKGGVRWGCVNRNVMVYRREMVLFPGEIILLSFFLHFILFFLLYKKSFEYENDGSSLET